MKTYKTLNIVYSSDIYDPNTNALYVQLKVKYFQTFQLIHSLPNIVQNLKRRHQCMLKINSQRSQTLPSGGKRVLNNNDSQSQNTLAKWQLTKEMANSFVALHSCTEVASRNNVHTSKMKIVFNRKSFMEQVPSQDRKFVVINLLHKAAFSTTSYATYKNSKP